MLRRILRRAAALVARVAEAAEPLWEAVAYAGCLYIIGGRFETLMRQMLS